MCGHHVVWSSAALIPRAPPHALSSARGVGAAPFGQRQGDEAGDGDGEVELAGDGPRARQGARDRCDRGDVAVADGGQGDERHVRRSGPGRAPSRLCPPGSETNPGSERSRVEDWRGTRRPVSSPRRIKRRERFSRTPLRFASRVMGPIGVGALSGLAHVSHSVVIEESERLIEPCRTPPLPPEALAVPRPHHMAPHLLLHPVPHVTKAPCLVPNPEVVHPAAQDRIDHRHHLLHRLRSGGAGLSACANTRRSSLR